MDKETLISKILEKKELKGISREVVNSYLITYIKKRSIKLENLSDKDSKPIVKVVRAHLRNLVGRFHIKESKFSSLLEKKDWDGLLKTHTSTKERLESYDELKKYIYSMHPKSILDLGCGLNPLAIANSSIYYYASDINGRDLQIVNEFFNEKKIKGETFIRDLIVSQSDFPKADLVLMFKLVDFLEKVSPKITENILKELSSKDILISFATRKLSGRVMSSPDRTWFENLCLHKEYKYKKFIIGDEIFYHLHK